MKRSAAAEISFMMIGAEAKSGMNMRCVIQVISKYQQVEYV